MKINDEVTFVSGSNKGRKGIVLGFLEGDYINIKVTDGSVRKMVTTTTDSVVVTAVKNPNKDSKINSEEIKQAKKENVTKINSISDEMEKAKNDGKTKVELSGVPGSELMDRIKRLGLTKKKALALANIPLGSMGYITRCKDLPMDTYKKLDDALSKYATMQKETKTIETPILNAEIEEKEQKEEIKMEDIIVKDKKVIDVVDELKLISALSKVAPSELHNILKKSLGIINWIELMRISIEEFNKIAEIFNGEE